MSDNIQSASVPPEPPTLSDEPRAGRRRNTALPPIGDVSPHLCYECGGAHPLVVREKRMARWGQDPEVEIEDEWYRCPKCGDGYYTSEQAQAHERALWLATIAALRAEVALRDGMIDSLCADVVREAAQARALRIELAEARAEAARVRKIHLARHKRLSEAVGLAPGYSADATVDRAIELARAARAASGEGKNG